MQPNIFNSTYLFFLTNPSTFFSHFNLSNLLIFVVLVTAEYSLVPSHREDCQLVFFEEHLYRKEKTEADKVRYICYKSKCAAKLVVVGTTCHIPSYSGRHNHGSQMEQKLELEFKKRVREACKNSSRSTREIYNEERAKYILVLGV